MPETVERLKGEPGCTGMNTSMKEKLTGSVCNIGELSNADIDSMYLLMEEFYDHMERAVFLSDLRQKDWCIMLRDEAGKVFGFSTQKLLKISVGEEQVYGIFSGDTIIHKKQWGSMELFRTFARFFFRMAEDYPRLYWFLISKGYKTYKILPSFFREFYPDCKQQTPPDMKEIMDVFGTSCFPGCYAKSDGVIHYNTLKDSLKDGVADLTPGRMKDPDIAFFLNSNPGYLRGDDLVCLTILDKANLIPKSHKILFAGEEA